ncbi:MAG: hypothetical protein IKU97_06885 [Tidjanibacter sp.]|nr:hypothetical protein [Tidjanibacter sp.]
MKKSRFLIAICVLVVLLAGSLLLLLRERATSRRLTENNRTLTSQLSHSNHLVASQRLSIGRLRMTIGELEELRRADAERVRSLGLSLRNVQALSLTATSTLLDTLLTPSPARLSDSIHSPLRWSDHWISLTLTPQADGSQRLHLQSCDTLTQVVHRIPHRWWIFRWGTKAIRQEIYSSNPHTKLVFSEYIEIEN